MQWVIGMQKGLIGVCQQTNSRGRLKHFVSMKGLESKHLETVLNTVASFTSGNQKVAKKVPLLRGKTVVNMFFETSTRTRTSFELAAKRLSADVLNLHIPFSAVRKGESLLDTLRNIQAMNVDIFVVRHSASGAVPFIVNRCPEGVAVINAVDGCHEHPTQAMLDAYTIRQCKGDFSKLVITIIGDILHSRVARLQIIAFSMLGAKTLRLVGPRTLVPDFLGTPEIEIYHDCDAAMSGSDVVIVLRLQNERMQGGFIPSRQEYFKYYGLDSRRLALTSRDAIVMHPGPVNRDVEMSSEVADGPQSVILRQVNNGVAVRMAIMALVVDGQREATEVCKLK